MSALTREELEQQIKRLLASSAGKKLAKTTKNRRNRAEYDNQSKYWFLRRVAKRRVIEALGGCCFCCGIKEIRFLTVNHKKKDGAAHRRQIGGGGIRLYQAILAEGCPTDRYEVLCWNCHMSLNSGEPCPHQLGKTEAP